MGLKEKISEMRVRTSGLRQAESIVTQAQRRLEKEAGESWKLAEKQKAEQERALREKLQKLLGIVGARELLGILQKEWRGRIDKKPYEVPKDVRYGSGSALFEDLHGVRGMGLSLRYRFRDSEPGVVHGMNGWRDEQGSYWSKREAALHAVVGLDNEGLPFVTTIYGLHRSSDTPLNNVFFYGTEMVASHNPDTPVRIAYMQPEIISPDDPSRSKEILENQLTQIYENSESFWDLERQANSRIARDPHLPGRARKLASPLWQERLPAQIPVVNLFIR